VVGIVGAKMWFIVLHRRAHRMEGWCIQGFIAGATLAAAILLVVLNMPIGVFLDVTAPGLLVAMAVGKVGCFFAGCCGGPPTASRWGVWSSDQRVGARRLPTQLLESVLAGILGLVAAVGHGPVGGAFFFGGLAAYPGATESAASARRAAQDEAGWAGNFSPGSACARRSRRLARSVTVEYVYACCICRQLCPTSGPATGIRSSLHERDLGMNVFRRYPYRLGEPVLATTLQDHRKSCTP
jgi:hypothetical protein